MDDLLLERVRAALAPDFDVERLIAAGGMGLVYIGTERSLERPVAIKVVRPELATAETIERFLREARTLAALAHPHIVPIHRVGERDGIAYYVMEYLAGETLAERIARGPLPAGDVVRIARDVLTALGAAHGRGIVHRDVKPSNIFLLSDRAVLTDFGIAKGLASAPLTQTGGIVGTPAYMSPEQLTGGDATPATDVYALGLVLYQALTGREWLPATPPERADWSGVPRGLKRPLQRALALDPGQRWRDVAPFRRALHVRRRVAPWAWAVAAVPLALIAWGVFTRCCAPRPLAVPDVAILRFSGATAADSVVGADIARTTYEILRTYNRITLAPAATLRGGSVARAAHVVHGEVERAATGVTLHLAVRDSLGALVATVPPVAATSGWAAGEAAALGILEAVARHPFPPPDACRPATVEAYQAWLDGEQAFQRDDLEGADLSFRRAVDRDPRFCTVQFRLWIVERWRRVPVTVDLVALLAGDGAHLPAADSLLVAAEVAATRAERRRLHERAVWADRFSGYAPLLYGSELFHRGPLDGIPADSGVPLMREALRRDRSLAPAHDQLVWALIRLGRRAEARLALDSLLAAVVDPRVRTIDPALFEFAFRARFDPGALASTPGALPVGSVEMVRLGLAFDIAIVQRQLGLAVAAQSDVPPLRAHGLVAAGLATIQLGAPLAGLALLDSAAALSPALALQAVEYRALALVLGLPGPTEEMAESARARLRTWSGDETARARATWARAASAVVAGDTAGLGSAVTALRRTHPGLATILAGLARGQRDPRAALALTDALRGAAWEERDGPGDPFARAVLHRARAGWFDAVREAAAAERERRWYESSDFTGWLQGEIQAAEVDWTAGMYVRSSESLRRAGAGDAAGCAESRRVLELWVEPEPAVASLVAAARAVVAACP